MSIRSVARIEFPPNQVLEIQAPYPISVYSEIGLIGFQRFGMDHLSHC